MTNKFKVGDSVRRKSPRAKAAKIVGEYGKGWYDISYPSTDKRYRIHQRFLELIVKPESKDRSELYKLLPRVDNWGGKMDFITVDLCGQVITWDKAPENSNPHYLNKWCFTSQGNNLNVLNEITLPPSINWKDTLVSREEMERWEKSQEPTEDELNMPIEDYYMKKLNESDPESYEIDWSLLDEKATHHVFDSWGDGICIMGGNVNTDVYTSHDAYWNIKGEGSFKPSNMKTPHILNWKKSLRVNPNLIKPESTKSIHIMDQLIDAIQPEPTETPQAKVERLKAELKEAEQELDMVTPVMVDDVSIFAFDHDRFAFDNNEYRMEISESPTMTSLTFFKK